MLNKIFLSGLIALGLSGCFLAPAIDSFNKLGVTESDRRNLLAERIQGYHDALQIGDAGQMSAFLAPSGRDEISNEFRKNRDAEKVVDSRIESVIYDNSAYAADVEVRVRAYKVPFYVVNERLEKQHWKFNLTSGWLLESREKI